MRRAHSAVALVALVAVVALGGCGSDERTAISTGTPSTPSTSATSSTSSTSSHSSTTVAPAPTTTAPYLPPRALLIGDSTLLAVERYNGYRALRGFEYAFDAKSCRTLGIPSCGDPPLPPNTVDAIGAADGSFDYVVVMAGYDEWWTSFPDSFDEVVTAARAKGAKHIIWLNYREGVGYKLLTGEAADESFVRNNQTLRDKVASGEFPEVLIAQWYPHTKGDTGWITRDGIHLTLEGALGVADYISRWIAFVEKQPCPMPTVPGGPLEAPCANPDTQPPIADITALY